MHQLRWDDNYATSIKQLDAANESLFFLLRHLFTKGVECDERICVGELTCRKVDALVSFLSRNFAAEEALMDSCGYPSREAHGKEHNYVISRLLEWRRTCVCRPTTQFDLSNFIAAWTRKHVGTFDRTLGAWMQRNAPATLAEAVGEVAPAPTAPTAPGASAEVLSWRDPRAGNLRTVPVPTADRPAGDIQDGRAAATLRMLSGGALAH